MTVDKYDEPDYRTPEQNSSATVKDGFADPAGEYPRKPYLFEPSTNKAGRGRARNELSIGGGFDGMTVELPIMQSSRYPHNQVMETTSGHVIEIDDTPGAERVLIKHNTGSGVEFRSDGSTVMKTEANSVTSVAGSSCLIVEGEAEMQFNGNLNLSVTGDLNLNVGGNINTNVAGNNTSRINGASRETVHGAKGSIVAGNRSEITTGTITRTGLGDVNDIVKGSHKHTIEGPATWTVGGTLKQSSTSEMIMSSNNMNIGANDLSVFGASGTIGGSGIVHYGVTYHGSSFYGDLIGTAETAVTADVSNSQNYASGSTGTANGYIATDNGTTTAAADTETMDAYLTQSGYGAPIVQVDEGGHLKDLVDKTIENGGVSSRPLTIREVRASLREPTNMSNETFVGNAVASGRLSPKYLNAIPSAISRIANSVGQVRLPNRPVNTSIARTERYQPSKNTSLTSFIPDPKYDPNNIPTTTKITGQIELGKGIRMARFLGGTGNKVTLDHIATREEKLQLARQYTLHANAIGTILNNRGEFKDYRLVVVEGLYTTGPTETLTQGSLTYHASRGESVVYELHNTAGKIDPTTTYELALWWKDNLNYDKLSLSYDTFDPSGEMTTQIVLTMPEVDKDYNLVRGRYQNKLETLFNMNLQGNELIEVSDLPS